MSRYIDVDTVLSNLPDDLPYKASVKRVLIQAPTADVVERKRGEWIGEGERRCCFNCKNPPLYNKGGTTFAQTFYRIKTKFCPNCGADMRGEKDESI